MKLFSKRWGLLCVLFLPLIVAGCDLFKGVVSGGGGEANVDLRYPADVTVTLTGVGPTLTYGTDLTAKASTNMEPDSYAWYADGAILDGKTADSCTLGASLASGPHSLMVTISQDGHAFSAMAYFTVL